MRAVLALVLAFATWLELGETCGAAASGCTVSASPPSFASYAPLSGASVSASGTVTATCATGGTVTAKLSIGNGTYAARTLLGPAGATLNYNLYTDAAHSMIWGDGTAGTVTVSGTLPNGTPATATVYGYIPGGQDVKVGTYASTITVTLTF